MPHIPQARLTPPKHVQDRMLESGDKPPPQLRSKPLGFRMRKISLNTYRPNTKQLIALFFGHGHS